MSVWFYDKEGFIQNADIIAECGPWLWLSDGAAMYTVLRSDCYGSKEDLPDYVPPGVW